MSDISKIKLEDETYNIKDDYAREIIKKVSYIYNNIEELKNDTLIQNNDIVKTLGYYEKNDNGGSYYTITNQDLSSLVDNGSVIKINDTLYAQLIQINNIISTKQFGAKSDYNNDNTDDSNAFNNCITYAINNNLQVKINEGNYLLNNTINVLQDNTNQIRIFGDGVSKTILNTTANVGLYIERGIIVLEELTIRGNNNNITLQLGTSTPSNINDSIHWSNIRNLGILNAQTGILLKNVFDCYFENIDIYYLFNTTLNYGIRSTYDNNNNVFNRIRIEDMNEGTAVSFEANNVIQNIIFNDLHIEPRNLKASCLQLIKCAELTVNDFCFVNVNNNQNPDTDYHSSFIFDNSRNIIFNNNNVDINPKSSGTGTSQTNKMFILKNSLYNIKFENGFFSIPFTIATDINNLFNNDSLTNNFIIQFSNVAMNELNNFYHNNRISLSRTNNTTSAQRFDFNYGNDNFILVGRNQNYNKTYDSVDKLSGITAFNFINDIISSSIIPHVFKTINNSSSFYYTEYGRQNFAGTFICMVNNNNTIYLCVFTANAGKGPIKIVVNTDNIFSSTSGTASKFNIYNEGANLVFQNKLGSNISFSLLPFYMNTL